MTSLTDQFEDLRKKAESCLAVSGSAQEAKPFVTAMAETALPLSSRYKHIQVETLISDNVTGKSQQEVVECLTRMVKALGILERYGCNLLNPNRPKFWRSVKFNNPVFKASVDPVKGGRDVLMLYGYTDRQEDGLSFPDDVTAPDVRIASVVATEIMTLREELDLLSKGTHSHPEFFEKIVPSLLQQEEEKEIISDAVVIPVPKPRTIKRTSDLLPRVSAQLCGICGIHDTSTCCKTCAQQLCTECDKLYHSHPDRVGHQRENLKTTKAQSMEPSVTTAAPFGRQESLQPSTITEWVCMSCTMVNSGSNVLCEACERPRLAKQATPLKTTQEGEKRAVSPEEVYAALNMCGGSNPFDWLQSELPHLLDEICALAASMQLDYRADDQILLSRAEAKQAWVSSGGNTERAVARLLKKRADQLCVLRALGFVDRLECEKTLFRNGGDLESTLSHLQQPLLEPFHQNIWKEQPQVPFNIDHPDKEWLCRRLLGLYNLPSWGRSQLALNLLQEPNTEYSLEDVIQAVRDHHDRDFINRILNNECQICYGSFPQRKMQALTFCQCSMCSGCFQQHFTVALRDKHIRDMVCPVCEAPDINDPEALQSYFSILDVQLRVCLEPEVHELFGKKLMEHTLKQDPKFLWCCHCTNGFINDKDELKVTCQNCQKSFCSQCKKPWEDQHEGLSCNDFQRWKRENDPEYQKQGLAGFLQENGISQYIILKRSDKLNHQDCPKCKFQYALAKGGCMHFTCSQCRYEFCCGCNNPYHKTKCTYPQCSMNGLHAHHPRDCLSYLRDWEPDKLQALLQEGEVEFNTAPPEGTESAACSVLEQKDGAQVLDVPCGIQTQEGHAGLCIKHYREYLVSLINAHSLDPAVLMDVEELIAACKRYQVYFDKENEETEEEYKSRLQQKLMEIPLGDKVSRNM
ncbi:hypothetical protein NFI96_013677 [Prochilodus magdalenae]|nr:hypothetical protein NFI96_013677 [Prochilodus magdalenae]